MRPLLLALAFALAFLTPAVAEGCVPSTSSPKHEIAGTLYVSDDCEGVDPSPPNDHCITPLGGKWIYMETNGIAGLQRRDEIEDNTCEGQIPADTLVL